MDYENERYVRQYVTESVNFLCLPWQSRMLLRYIVVYFDRAGLLSLGAHDPVKALAVKGRLPEHIVAAGLPPLMRGGHPLQMHEHGGESYLFWPNFMPAQEARQSDKLRARAARERRRQRAHAEIVTGCDISSRYALDTQGDYSSQDVTHNVTNRDSEDTSATKSSQSSSAVLCSAEGGRASDPPPPASGEADEVDPRALDVLAVLSKSRAASALGMVNVSAAEGVLGVADSAGRQTHEQMLASVRQACADADIVHSGPAQLTASEFAKKLRTFVGARPRTPTPAEQAAERPVLWQSGSDLPARQA